ncbi:MAG: metal-dependent hydrolase [Candidatus Moranbacteria bacterium CG_4_10_14_3_um_filter_45_9]|nr:MAG: metal-dependent hydrolase [Candidatus Moranbacteria bacterium CG_4_10_14_3_um_filter_45_9]PJA85037.1 MAG: metal-dependent hydrolase [Candidatus Moranbacteria bacterium CG_4_9_14_3_um_filter_45_14]
MNFNKIWVGSKGTRVKNGIMGETVLLENGAISCVVKKNRRVRYARLAVHRDGSVVLTLPFFVSYGKGKEFLESKVNWIREKIQAFALEPEHLLFRGSIKEYKASKNEAKRLIEERLAYFQKVYLVSWKRVSIRNQKTRWGSCSRGGNLSFNYRLLLLPPHLCDYVIVHELCHLREMNHGAKFWALVAITFLDYKKLRQEMRLL